MKFIEIAPLTADQLDAAVHLDQLALGGLWTIDGYRRELDSPQSDLLVLIQRSPPMTNSPDQLLGIGCLWAILEEAHITTLAVHPHYQRQGLGQALLVALFTAAWQRNLEWLTLEVRVSNQVAIALYEKFGFEQIGRRRNYYPNDGEDALILWRKGLQKPEFSIALQSWQQKTQNRLQESGWELIQAPQSRITG